MSADTKGAKILAAARVGLETKREAARQKLAMRRTLRRWGPRLMPGTWHQYGRVAVLAGQQLPGHFRDTVLERELDGRRVARRGRFECLKDSGGTSIAVVLSGDGAVLLSLNPPFVERCYPSAVFSPEEIELRRRFQLFVPSPRFVVSSSRDACTEEFLDGTSLAALDPEGLRRQVGVMFGQFEELAEAEVWEMPEPTRVWLRALHDELLVGLHEQQLEDAIDGHLLSDMLLTGRATLSKGRAFGRNNLMSLDSQLYALDFEPGAMKLLPAWFNAIYLLISSASDGLLSGKFDEAVGRHLRCTLESQEPLLRSRELSLRSRLATIAAALALDNMRVADPGGVSSAVLRTLRDLQRIEKARISAS